MNAPAKTRDPELIALFGRALWEVDHKKLEDLGLEREISTLGIDSVAMLEVIGFIEEELDIHLPQERLQTVQTLGDLADAIAEIRATAAMR